MEQWFTLALLTAVIWTIVDLFDKYVIDHELRDPILATIFNGVGIFIIFTIISSFFGMDDLPLSIIILAVIAGALYSAAILLYFEGMRKEDVSLAAPLLSTAPLFVLMFATFFLDERFTTMKYVGIFLIVAGAMLISFKSLKGKDILNHSAGLVIGAAAMVGLRNTLMKHVTLVASVWSVLFWVGVGGMLMTLLIFAMHHPHIKRRWNLGIRHLLIIGAFSATGYFFLTLAIASGPASLVSAIIATKPLLVFLVATTISIIYPRFISEKITKGILLQKSVATILIVLGGVLLL